MGTILKLLQGVVPLTRYPYSGVEDPCNLCGSDKKRILCEYDRRIKKLRTVICLNCGLLRTDPMPTEDELSDYYRLSYRFDYQMAGSKPPKFHIARSKDHAKARYERLAPTLSNNASILDFGSGSGEFLAECKSHGCKVTGIEPGQAYAKFATETYGLKIHAKPWGQVDLGDQKFDAITAFHVFEHLRDPVAALRWLTSHLADNGVIAIAVPDLSPDFKKTQLFEELHFAHVYGFVPETLELLARFSELETDPRVPSNQTDMVFHKASPDTPPPEPDPTFSHSLADRFGNTDVVGHLLKGGWIVDAWRRASRDIKDTFRSK